MLKKYTNVNKRQNMKDKREPDLTLLALAALAAIRKEMEEDHEEHEQE